MTKPKKPTLEAMIASRRARSAYIIKQWGVKLSPEVTQIDIDYWLLFIVDQYGSNLASRRRYVEDFNVVGKIERAKKNGSWPLPAVRNQHFLIMFKLAYKFPNHM